MVEATEGPKTSQNSEEKPADVAADDKQIEVTDKKEVVSSQTGSPDVTKELVKENKEDHASSSQKSIKDSNITDEANKIVKDEALKIEPSGQSSKLSPLAAEFVPKGTYSLESAVSAPEFVPAPVPQENDRPQLLRQKSNTPEHELMNCVKDVLFGLTQSPGELDDYVDTLVKMLMKWFSTLNSLKEVVDLIFEYVSICSLGFV